MVGLIRKKGRWRWAAFGKHPVGGDYLKAGEITPLLKSFSLWMAKGYSGLTQNEKSSLVFYWRFWARGPNRELLCGIIRSSSDKYGRSYPLLLIGSGRKGFISKEWDLIPYACEKPWMELEALGKREFRNIRELRKELKRISEPENDIESLVLKSEICRGKKIDFDTGINSDFMNKMNNPDGLIRAGSFTVNLGKDDIEKGTAPVAKLLALLKRRTGSEPGVVLLGGPPSRKRLICLKRNLVIDDFKVICGYD